MGRLQLLSLNRGINRSVDRSVTKRVTKRGGGRVVQLVRRLGGIWHEAVAPELKAIDLSLKTRDLILLDLGESCEVFQGAAFYYRWAAS